MRRGVLALALWWGCVSASAGCTGAGCPTGSEEVDGICLALDAGPEAGERPAQERAAGDGGAPTPAAPGLDGGQLAAGGGGSTSPDTAADDAEPDAGPTRTDAGGDEPDAGPTLTDTGADAGCTDAGSCAGCARDSDCGPERICISQRCAQPRCGDGVVTAPEPCDPNAGGSQNDVWHCSADCERMTIYVPCMQDDDCTPETEHGTRCMDTGNGAKQCIPSSGLGLNEYGIPLQQCPQLSADSYTQKFFSNIHCALECMTAADCPPQLTRCTLSAFAGLGENDATRICEP